MMKHKPLLALLFVIGTALYWGVTAARYEHRSRLWVVTHKKGDRLRKADGWRVFVPFVGWW